MPKLKPWILQCCGCGRLMGRDGMIERKAPIKAEKVASYDSKAEADDAALSRGWSVSDGEGPNHRCPACREAAIHPSGYAGVVYDENRGAYIESKDLADVWERA